MRQPCVHDAPVAGQGRLLHRRQVCKRARAALLLLLASEKKMCVVGGAGGGAVLFAEDSDQAPGDPIIYARIKITRTE